MQDLAVRLIVFSDQTLFRTSLARLLASEAGIEVVRECASADEALEVLKELPVDIVLMDLPNPGPFLDAARSAGYQGRLLLIAETADADRLSAALASGASGIFEKSEAPDRLILAIHLVAAGALWVDQKMASRLTVPGNQLANPRLGGRLEDREARVIQGIMEGHTTRKIGDELEISEGAVKNILQVLFAKTGVRKRSQLVRLALEGSLGSRFLKTSG